MLCFTWNSLFCLKENYLQKCAVMAISYQEIIFHIYLSLTNFFCFHSCFGSPFMVYPPS